MHTSRERHSPAPPALGPEYCQRALVRDYGCTETHGSGGLAARHSPVSATCRSCSAKPHKQSVASPCSADASTAAGLAAAPLSLFGSMARDAYGVTKPVGRHVRASTLWTPGVIGTLPWCERRLCQQACCCMTQQCAAEHLRSPRRGVNTRSPITRVQRVWRQHAW